MNTEKLLSELARIEPALQTIQQEAPVVVTLEPVRTAAVLRVLHDVLGQLVIAADDAATLKARQRTARQASKKKGK